MNIGDDDIAANAEKAFYSDKDTSLQKIEFWAKYCADIVVSIAFFVLAGRRHSIDFLKQPVPHPAAISREMAFTYISPGISLLLFVSEKIAKQKNADAFISCKENSNTL